MVRRERIAAVTRKGTKRESTRNIRDTEAVLGRKKETERKSTKNTRREKEKRNMIQMMKSPRKDSC